MAVGIACVEKNKNGKLNFKKAGKFFEIRGNGTPSIACQKSLASFKEETKLLSENIFNIVVKLEGMLKQKNV